MASTITQSDICTQCKVFPSRHDSKWCYGCHITPTLHKQPEKCIFCHTNPRRQGHYSCTLCSIPPTCQQCHKNKACIHNYTICNTCYDNTIQRPTPSKKTTVLGGDFVQTRYDIICTFCGFDKKGFSRCPNCCR